MSVSTPFAVPLGVGISSACGWPHARAPTCKDQHCSPKRLFDLLGTPRKGRTDPFMQSVVEEQCVEDNADPSLLPKIAWWGLWFSWTGQTPDSLLLSRFIQGIKTLPFVCHEVPESAVAEAQDESQQANEIAAASSTALEAVKRTDKRSLMKEAAGKVDHLLLEHVHNKKGLCVEDRKNDLHLIKDYQQALRAVHAAPDTVFGAVLSLGAGVDAPRLRQPSQQPSMEFTEAQKTQRAHPTHATLSEISSDDEDIEYELVSHEAPSLRSRATTVEEVLDEEEPLKCRQELSSQKGKGVAIAPAEEKTFKQAWEDLKVMAQGIEEISKPEDSLFQKTCLTILNGFDRFLGFIPFLPLAVGAIKYVCYDLRKLAQELELENRNAVRKALIEISGPILASSKEGELDMEVAKTINNNTDTAMKSLAVATGQALKVTAEDITDTVRKDFKEGAAAITSELSNVIRQELANQRAESSSPELIAEKDAEIARLRKELEETKAEKEGLQKQNEKLVDALINRA